MLTIQTNVGSLQAQKNLNTVQKGLNVSFNRLSSGYRINSAADDAAGLAISDTFTAQIRSYSVAERNANDGISMAQTAEGSLGQMTGLLTRMRELAVQSANGSNSATDRDYLNTEFGQLKAEIARIQVSTTYDGNALIGATTSSVSFQVGISAASTDRIAVTFGGLGMTTLLAAGESVAGATSGLALTAIGDIDTALGKVETARARFGAVMNRFETTTSNIQTVRTNLAAANSRIRDVDVAEESAALSRSQVLSQAAAAVLAQANQAPQLALGLLR
ncbi:MAG TPA: flagellin [Polyangiaceae bacterium]|jgi:flagellin|nr:flagellin [Polyangiaceae bacterium]